jgi:hypothetical protein
MGFNFLGTSDNTYYSKTPEPDPNIFKIIRKEMFSCCEILEVKYGGCTTFDGVKLLLIKDHYTGGILDPHLLGDNHIVIARFEPTQEGWNLARLCVKNLCEEYLHRISNFYNNNE